MSMNPITRRDMFGRASLLGAALAVGLPDESTAQSQSPAPPPAVASGSKLKVIVTGGHPGDPEYGCGGTIALFADQGHDVVILYLNKGEGTDQPGAEPGSLRAGEAAKACAILKARPMFAGQIDAHAIVDSN